MRSRRALPFAAWCSAAVKRAFHTARPSAARRREALPVVPHAQLSGKQQAAGFLARFSRNVQRAHARALSLAAATGRPDKRRAQAGRSAAKTCAVAPVQCKMCGSACSLKCGCIAAGAAANAPLPSAANAPHVLPPPADCSIRSSTSPGCLPREKGGHVARRGVQGAGLLTAPSLERHPGGGTHRNTGERARAGRAQSIHMPMAEEFAEKSVSMAWQLEMA